MMRAEGIVRGHLRASTADQVVDNLLIYRRQGERRRGRTCPATPLGHTPAVSVNDHGVEVEAAALKRF